MIRLGTIGVLSLTLVHLGPRAPEGEVDPPDSEAAPYAYVKATPTGRAYFKMVPDPDHPSDRDRGSGTLYRVAAEGPDEPVWTTRGWYAFEVHPSEDGEHLVRLGNWPRGQAPHADHLAIAFYERGTLLASYSTADLVKDPSRVPRSVSHYMYRRAVPGFEPGGTRFTLITVDDIEYVFDATTGEIVSAKTAPPEGK